jgi:predicted nuclease of predicted toxin-antitoxin system
MPRTIRFHLDENVDPAVADGMRRLGADVTTTAEAGLTSASDLEQLDHIRAQSRVMFTEDADFLRLHSQGEPHPGIAY